MQKLQKTHNIRYEFFQKVSASGVKLQILKNFSISLIIHRV